MSQAKIRNVKQKPQSSAMSTRLGEVFLILFIVSAVFIAIALGSYSAIDPSWSHIGDRSAVLNLEGVIGAWCADILFSIFGYMAYFIPVILLYAGFAGYKNAVGENSVVVKIFRAVGLVMILVAGSGIAAQYFSFLKEYVSLPMSAGGILGEVVKNMLLVHLDVVGTTLILLGMEIIGVTIFSGISWVYVVAAILKMFFATIKLSFLLPNKLVKLWLKQRSWYQAHKERALALKTSSVAREKNISDEAIVDNSFMQKKTIEISKNNHNTNEDLPQHAEGFMLNQRYKAKIQTNDGDYIGPPALTLLEEPVISKIDAYSEDELRAFSKLVEERLLEFGAQVKVVAVSPGPIVTRFELDLAPGLKVSKISGLAKDLARALSVVSVRIVEVIPGKAVIGLEIPNEKREKVGLKDVLRADTYQYADSPITLGLGKNIAGVPVSVDLARMPHLLVAGTTGAGKSVGINAMLLSILYKATPKDVRMILIDPKMLELSVYDGIPHLLTPVVTDMKDAASALRWCVTEMERRYKLMAALGVRNIDGFNKKILKAVSDGLPIQDPVFESGPITEKLPYIVVIIDEFADMMLVVGKKVEELIARIAQKARAAGIHLILATQRPSVDVITGVIKANIPTRISYQVSSKIDSRTILDQSGAEQLLGSGDMLYLPPGSGVPVRVHGAFVSDSEVHAVVSEIKSKNKAPQYIDEVCVDLSTQNSESEIADELYEKALQIVLESRRASISNVQRRLKIGYNRAANLLEMMEARGVVSAMESNGSREVLVPGIKEV